MKLLPSIMAFFVLFSCGESSSSDSEKEFASMSGIDTTAEPSIISSNASNPLKNIEDIKKEYSHIISKVENNRVDSSFFTYNCHDEKKGRVVYLSDDEGLRLIKHTYDEYSHFFATDEYFVKNDSLFFVFYKHVAWSFDTQAQGESQTIDKVTEKRFYIINNKALQCLEKKYTIRSASSENMQPQMVANKKTDCSSLEAVLNKFELLANHRNHEKDPGCLEK